MLFSVIIPTFNRAQLLRRAIESVLGQTFADYELIIIDDGSSDDTESVVGNFGDRIRYLKQSNKGPGAARNLGIERARGEYLAFLDSDDVWLPWTLATHARVIEENKCPSFISGTGIPIERMEETASGVLMYSCKSYSDMISACNGAILPVGGTPSVAVKTQCVRELGGFCSEPINGEDSDLWLRLGKAKHFVRIEQPALFAQSYHASTITKSIDRSIRGSLFLVERETSGYYPGGERYATHRRRIIAATARSVSLSSLQTGELDLVWLLYCKTLVWNFLLGRVRYLGTFPFLFALAWLRRNLASN